MMIYIFTTIVAIHGLIHLVGLSGSFDRRSNPGVKRVSGQQKLLWLFAALIFIVTALATIFWKVWWPSGLVAVLLSQLLIIRFWKEARFGTLVNCIIFVGVVLNFADWRFYKVADNEAAALVESKKTLPTVVTREMLDSLPYPVRKWLGNSGIVGKETVHTARLKQKGALRMAPGSKWLPAEATQYFRTDLPAFVWIARISAGKFGYIAGKDVYHNGRGNMIIKVLSLIPVANASGKEIDQGTLVRYLAEIQWFPSAALGPYIEWKAIDTVSAMATMSYGGVTASGLFTFGANGDITRFEAQRYMEQNGTYSMETWCVPITAYRVFEGVRVPSAGTAIWKLRSGDFSWFNWEITNLEFNRQDIYQAAFRR